MDNIKTYFAVGAVIVGILIVGAVYPRPTVIDNTSTQINSRVDEWMEARLGAIPGDSIDSPTVKIGGVNKFFIGKPIAGTSSVLCSIKNPYAPATTSIDRITVKRTSGFAAATTFDISTSTTAFASSTPALVRAKSVAAGIQDTVLWTPRHATSTYVSVADGVLLANTLYWNQSVITSPYVLTGTEWITVRVATTSGGTETISGYCNFEGTKL